MRKRWDMIAYAALLALLSLYAAYIMNTCEELGCLAVIVPVIAGMALTVIAFFVSLWLAKKDKSKGRRAWNVVLGVLSLAIFAAVAWALIA